MGHPFRDVAIVGVFNTKQARVLEGYDSQTIALEAALGAVVTVLVRCAAGAILVMA